jgi:tagatose-6-phosphate ketose/aldose isomerase
MFRIIDYSLLCRLAKETSVTLANIIEMQVDQQEALGLVFTPKEIAQQPETWEVTLDIFKRNQKRICDFLEEIGLCGPIETRPVVMLVGAGTSDYIGQALVLLLRRNWGCEVFACPSTDLLPNLEEYIVPGRNYLWISFSRSGDSPEGVAVLERAIELYSGIAHMVVTCNEDARMIDVCRGYSRSCVVVLDAAVNDRSLAMTSSFTNMVVLGQCLAHAWSIEDYEPIFHRLNKAATELLQSGADLAERLTALDFPRICFIGGGSLFSVAKESALKVLEMTAGRVGTMSETVLGLRHGPMAALDGETLFVCFVSEDSRRALYARDLLREVGEKRIAAKLVAVGTQAQQEEIAPLCDFYLSVEAEVGDAYRPALDVIFGQLMGLYCSIFHQLKPDTPSPDGVISRVVPELGIY